METALFGRMQANHCIPNHLDYLGCSSDVIRVFDDRCSGMQSCEVRVTDRDIPTETGCIKGVMRYLQATYSCVRGESKN